MANKPDGNAKMENGLHDLLNEEMLPCHLSTDDDNDLVSSTLETCLKLALSQKSASEENIVRLQRELTEANVRMKKLEHVIRVRTGKAKHFAKSLAAAETERESLRNELKLSQQEKNEAVVTNGKLQELFTESLKTKNNRIKELEKENQALRSSRVSSPFHSGLPLESSNASPVYSSREDIFVRPSSMASEELPGHNIFTSGSITPDESTMENFEWDPYFGGLKISQHEVVEMVDDYSKLQQSYTESLRAKNEKIKQLEGKFETLRSRTYSSASLYSNASSECSFSTRQSEDLSSPYCSQDFDVTSPAYGFANTRSTFEQIDQTQHHKDQSRRYSSISARNRESRCLSGTDRAQFSHSQSNSFDLSAPSTRRTSEGPANITPTSMYARNNAMCNGASFLDNEGFSSKLDHVKKQQQKIEKRQTGGLTCETSENVTVTSHNSSKVPRPGRKCHSISFPFYTKPPVAGRRSLVKVSAENSESMANLKLDLSGDSRTGGQFSSETAELHETMSKRETGISRKQEGEREVEFADKLDVTQEAKDATKDKPCYKTRRERERETVKEKEAKGDKVKNQQEGKQEEANEKNASMATKEIGTRYKTRRQREREAKKEREATTEPLGPGLSETVTSPKPQLISEHDPEKPNTEPKDDMLPESSRKTHVPSPKDSAFSVSDIPDPGSTTIPDGNSTSEKTELATNKVEKPVTFKLPQTQSESNSRRSSITSEQDLKESTSIFRSHSMLSSKYHSALLSSGGLIKVAVSIPLWKKKLIEKKKLSGPSSGPQAALTKTEEGSAEPEWKKQLLARKNKKSKVGIKYL